MDSVQLFGVALRSLMRRKFTAAFAFILTLVIVLVGIALTPRTYRSEARLFVRLGRETVTLDPTATTGQTVAIQSSREIEVRSVRDMLGSRVLLENVIDDVGEDYVLDPPMNEPAPGGAATGTGTTGSPVATPQWLSQSIDTVRSWAAAVRLSDPIPARDKAIKELQDAIEIDGGSKSSVIFVSLESKSPTAARDLLAAYLDAYRGMHVRVNRAPENFEFFSAQTTQLQSQLSDARESLRQAKNEQGIVEITIRKQNLQEQLSELDLNIRNARARLAAADAALLASRKRLEQIPERLLTDQVTGIGDAATDTMRPELYRLEMEAELAKKMYAEGHPKREQIMAQLNESRAIYEKQSKERPTQTSTINQAWTEVQLKVIEEEATQAAVVAELDALQTQREELRTTLEGLNSAENRIAVLQEKVDLLQASHRQYAENLELSRIDEELRRQEISNVSIVQPPSLSLRPVKPNKRLIFAAGCILAIMNAVGLAMFRERHNLMIAQDRTSGDWNSPPDREPTAHASTRSLPRERTIAPSPETTANSDNDASDDAESPAVIAAEREESLVDTNSTDRPALPR